MSTAFVEKWVTYRDTRTATYAFRARTRYKAVADRLHILGLRNGDTVLDVGAGTCQFGQYLNTRGWFGEYVPVDAVIDGTNLETWVPPFTVDYVVSIEVLEHLTQPQRLLPYLLKAARKGVVITTPNCEAVDVILCDPTHVSTVPPLFLEMCGFAVERHSWFGVKDDSLLAWRRA